MTASPHRSDFWPQFARGARTFLPLAVSVAAYGLIWGVLAGQAGLSVAEVALMSGLVFGGASQFVALDLWTLGALPIGTIVFAAAIVNLRIGLMSATLRPLTAGLPRWRAVLAMALVTDENWALTVAETARGRGSLAFLLGSGALCWAAWLVSTLFGRLAGASLTDPARYGLDFAFTATFLVLLFGMWKGRVDLLPWLAAALVAVLTARLLPGQWHIVTGGLLGSLAGAIGETLLRRRPA